MADHKKRKGSRAPSFKKPLKRMKVQESSAARPESLSSILIVNEDVPDFPRGGARILSRQEEAEARAEADEEFEREEIKSKNSKRVNKNRRVGNPRDAEGDEWGSLFGEGISGKLPRFAKRVTLMNMLPGMKLWGTIVEVNPKDLVISLPGGLRGYVRAEEASDIFVDSGFKDAESSILCNIFHVGELVSCIVLQVDDDSKDGKGSKRIWLSLRLALLHKGLMLDAIQDGMVLTGYVKSIEDHGYIISFGTSFSGFSPRSNGDGDEVKIKLGQLIQGVVKSIDKARAVVYLNSDADLVSKSVVKDFKGLSIDLLVPGMMVNARVHATLENGVMLSFLTYFTGTVDIFHLQNLFPNASWKNDYRHNNKVNARILFIDPSSRAIGLTLNPYLVHNKAPPAYVKTGDIYDNARIVRVDRGIGLLLEIASAEVSLPVYVSIFDAANEEVKKLEKKFKEGSYVRVRVVGLRNLEGLGIGTLKAIAFEGSIFTHSDVKPGMLIKAKVISVDTFGAIVQFSIGVKALCPLPHMSEFEIVKPPKKFKIGAELPFRVLGCKSKRITVTHKKSLVKSKLNVVASFADATKGLVTHGWIAKIDKHGCFVRFYNGVQGFAHRSELGLEPGDEPISMYHVGQVVKCRIISSASDSRRINISFVISHKRVAQDDVARLGSIVSAFVDRLTPGAVIVRVNTNESLKGSILNEHLADHQGQASLMKSLLRPGHKFDQLLVLDVEGNNLILSAKYSLISSALELPLDVAQLHPNSVVHGYICNLIGTGCFVRFLGRLTGFSPQSKMSDYSIGDLSDMFYVGQSVRSYILNADNQTGRVTVSLKQSSCFSSNASFIQGYFNLDEKIAELQASDNENSYPTWVEKISIGNVFEVEIQEMKEYGVVVSFKDHSDAVGFISNYQLGGRNVEVGSTIKALVLDISRTEGLVDLSLKPELVSTDNERGMVCLPSKKKHKREAYMDLELHQTVNAVVEIVKENYMVLSVPEFKYAIGFASINDYNTQKFPHKHFVNGQSIIATVAAIPSSSTSGRLLLLLKSLSDVSETSSAKRAKMKSGYVVGSLVDAEITEIKPLWLLLKFGNGCRGRVHITEVSDDDCSMESPLNNFKIGQLLTARIVAKAHQSGKSGKGYQWELSIRLSKTCSDTSNDAQVMADEFNFLVGNPVRGYVVKVDSEWVWLTVAPHVMAQLFILDSSLEPGELHDFQKHYAVGQAVCGHILGLNKEKRLLRVTSCRSSIASRISSDHEIPRIDSSESTVSSSNVIEHVHEGDVLSGRIKKILPGVGGLLVQIGPHLYGKVHYTELTDMWMPQPLSGYKEGQFVKCTVLQISRSCEGFLHVDLSLRASFLGIRYANSAELDSNTDSSMRRFEKIEDLLPNMDVKAYVKNVTGKGCFIMLSRKIDARVLLSNLADGYIENPEKEFPVGKLVNGRILSVEPLSKRVDVSLKTEAGSRASKSDIAEFHNLHVGDVISGKIRRVEAYGLFITIDHTNLVGLCHISEIPDNAVESIETKYRSGDTIVTKILKVDKERQRIALTLENLSVDDSVVNTISNEGEHKSVDDRVSIDDPSLVMQRDNLASIHDLYSKQPDGGCPSVAQVESRAFVLPLEVILDDIGGSDFDSGICQEDVELNNKIAIINDRRSKKKEKEERELEINASEERLLRKDIPRSVDEFEKLVRSSPNSSFVWIKYMAFMLSLADVEKARSIAERALRTINIREEEEKLNIWVAYFNLENEYGKPREEAVKRTFQRALQYCDPKRLHLALLGMYERTEQHKLADELLDKMTKKFKNSCKVWSRRVQNLMKQGKDVQSVVNRALLCLPRNKHIKFISQSAILEFKCGVPDRGRSMFEGVLREYPKRTDLWSIYLDQEIRLGDVDVIRALFERATSLDLHPKKIKFLFKKYLEFEKDNGDEEKVEYVKKAALDYVERKLPK